MRALILLLAIVPALSAAQPKTFNGYGVGLEGCGNFIENRRTVNRPYEVAIVSWTQGFISAHNFYAAGKRKTFELNTLEGTTVLAYLDMYCRDNPLSTMAVGVDELVKTYTK